MTRSVCLKKIKALIAAAHDHVTQAKARSDRGYHDDASRECEEALAALWLALHFELAVAPPDYLKVDLKKFDIDPTGVPCECLECRPAKDVSRG